LCTRKTFDLTQGFCARTKQDETGEQYMAATAKKRPGRPRTRTTEQPGEYVGFRCPRKLKGLLEDAAAASGRSLSTEVQVRLENSVRDQRLFDEALDIEYGDGTAGIVALLREIIKLVASTATRGATWMSHPVTFDQVIQAINLALDTLRPPGDPDHLSFNDMLWSEGIDPVMWKKAGQIRAAVLLDAVVDPPAANTGLGPRAKPLAEKLGLGLVDRIRAADPDKIRRGLIEEMQRAVEEANR
jgi:hypothetical protein